MLAHSYGMQNPTGNPDIVSRFFRGAEYLGSLAVYGFFLISGILVTQSFIKQDNFIRFGILRLFRIWPGLCVNILITVVVVGLFFTNAPSFAVYLASEGVHQFVIINLLHIGGFESFIPSSFPKSNIPNAVNFPLWTLPVEVQCYMMVLVLGLLGFFRRPAITFYLIAPLSVFYVWAASTESRWPFTVFFFHRSSTYSFYPVVFFMAGMLLYQFRRKVILRIDLALAIILVYMMSRFTDYSLPFLYIAFGYTLLVAAGLRLPSGMKPAADYSYGVYIYGFVCQQMVASDFPYLGNYSSMLISVPLTLLFAAGSWHFVEKPAIGLSRRLTKGWSNQLR